MTKFFQGKSAILIWAVAVILVTTPTPGAAQTTIGMVVDGALDAFGGSISPVQVHVFDADTREVLGSLGLPGVPAVTGDCSISADGTTGYLTQVNNTVHVVDLTTTSSPTFIGIGIGVDTDPAIDIDLTSDGSFLVTCDGGVSNPPVSVVDTASGLQISSRQLTDVGFGDVSCNAVSICDNDSDVLVGVPLTGEVRRLTLSSGTLTDSGDRLSVGFVIQEVVCGPGGTTGAVVVSDPLQTIQPQLLSFTTAPLTLADSRGLENQTGGPALFGSDTAINAAGDRIYTNSSLPFFDAACGADLVCGLIEVHDFNSFNGQLGATAGVGTNDAPAFEIGPVQLETRSFGVDSVVVHPDDSSVFVSEHANPFAASPLPAAVNVYSTATPGSLIGPLSDTPGGLTPSTAILAPTGICLRTIGGGGGPLAFAAFDGSVKILLLEGDLNDTVFLNTTLTLGVGNDGFDLDEEQLTIQVEGVSVTIPKGSFEKKTTKKKEFFKFDGVIDGVTVELKIDILGGDSFTFKGSLAGVTLDSTDPVEVTLTIGDDSGTFEAFVLFI